jgi:hypothetical protein
LGKTPQPPPIFFIDPPSTPVKQPLVNRPYPPFVTNNRRRTATKSLLEVCSLFKSVSRADIRKWCTNQPHDAKCSLNTIFDIVCANPFAEVPETYYTAISALEGSTFDWDIIPCNQLRLLVKK